MKNVVYATLALFACWTVVATGQSFFMWGSNSPAFLPASAGVGCTFSNPSATAGPVAVNGSSSNCMRSDAAPAVQMASNTQGGLVQCDGTGVVCPTGLIGTNVPDRTVTASTAVAAGDMSGQINANGSGITITVPAISTTVLAQGMTVILSNQGSSSVTVSSTPTINGCTSPIGAGAWWSLTSNGTSLDCLAGGASSGGSGVTPIATQTASNQASIHFSSIPGTYSAIQITCQGIQPVTNAVTEYFHVGEGGTEKTGANYGWGLLNAFDGISTAAAVGQGVGSNQIGLSYTSNISNASNVQLMNRIVIPGYASTAAYKAIQTTTSYFDGTPGKGQYLVGGGTYEGDTNAITDVYIFFSSGNVSTGTCFLDGLS